MNELSCSHPSELTCDVQRFPLCLLKCYLSHMMVSRSHKGRQNAPMQWDWFGLALIAMVCWGGLSSNVLEDASPLPAKPFMGNRDICECHCRAVTTKSRVTHLLLGRQPDSSGQFIIHANASSRMPACFMFMLHEQRGSFVECPAFLDLENRDIPSRAINIASLGCVPREEVYRSGLKPTSSILATVKRANFIRSPTLSWLVSIIGLVETSRLKLPCRVTRREWP